MSFTGKASYSAGDTLPEIVEDVADLVSIVSPHETPLLDHLGDAKRPAFSTVHEWVEDTLLPNTDLVNQTSFTPNATDATSVTVDNGARFQAGDLVRPGEAREVMLVTGVSTNTLTVVRRYGGTPGSALADDLRLTILGNAALEGADAAQARFTNRARRVNYTQIFASTVHVSGTMQSVRAYGVQDEADFQKQERLRELLRDLENTVVNGTAPGSAQVGSQSGRRSLNGILRSITTNQFTPNTGAMPPGGGAGLNELTETLLNAAMRAVWDQSAGALDTILVGGAQKRRLNNLLSSVRRYDSGEGTLRDALAVYESDFGVCRVVLSRYVPADTMIFLDSSRVEVLPLSGRSFHYKPLAVNGDSVRGQVLGEYTLEFRNENAHGVLRGLAV